MMKILVITLLMAAHFSQAAVIDSCASLSVAACFDNAVDDGTGIARRDPVKHDFKTVAQGFEGESAKWLMRNSEIAQRARQKFPECSNDQNCLLSKLGKLATESALSPIDRSGFGDIEAYTMRKHETKQKIKEKIIGEGYQDKIQISFNKIKQLIHDRAQKLIPDSNPQKAIILQKIKSVSYDREDCQIDPMNISPSDHAVNAKYLRSSNRIKICSGFLMQNSSQFALAFFIAHEISHSVDPCHAPGQTSCASLSEADQKFYIPELLPRLRNSENSIGAKRNPLSKWEKEPTFCGDENKSVDQIGESFSDWMAAEVVPTYIKKEFPKLTKDQTRKGYSNIFRHACNEKRPNTFDEHPDVRKRIDSILAVQPEIRTHMGCSPVRSNYRYIELREYHPTLTPSIAPSGQGYQ